MKNRLLRTIKLWLCASAGLIVIVCIMVSLVLSPWWVFAISVAIGLFVLCWLHTEKTK